MWDVVFCVAYMRNKASLIVPGIKRVNSPRGRTDYLGEDNEHTLLCLRVCLSVCLPACLSACLPACLSACMPVFLCICLFCVRVSLASLSLCLCLSCLSMSVCLSLSLSVSVCISVSVSMCLSVYMYACMPVCLSWVPSKSIPIFPSHAQFSA